MWDFSLRRAFGMMLRTMPYILLRLAVYFGIAMAYVLVTGVGAGVGYGIGGFGDEGFRAGTTFWGGAIGFGLTAAVAYVMREYILYVVKTGHIAVLVELLDGRPLPDGKGQITFGAQVVKERFVEANVLFALDQLIKGVIGAITGIVRGLTFLLPIPGANQFVKIIRAFLKVAVGFIDEVILAHAMRTRSDNPWGSAQEALVLYGQNYKVMLKNAAFIALFMYGLSFIVFLVMLAPAAGLVYLIPGAWSAGGLVFALLFAWAFKVALLEPLAITCLMQVYFKTIEGQTPDPEWDAKLTSASSKFRELKDKAVSYVSPKPSVEPVQEN